MTSTSADRERAAQVVRAAIVPLYPMDKPVCEMTSYEQGCFKGWVEPIAHALADAKARERERVIAVVQKFLSGIIATHSWFPMEELKAAIRSGEWTP